MLRSSFVVCLALLAGGLFSQDAYHTGLKTQLETGFGLPSGSQWFLPNTETATFAAASSYGAVVTNVTPVGQPFSQARRFAVQQGANSWDAAHLYRNTAALAAGDHCLIVIWLRALTPDARVTLLAENTVTYHKEVYAVVRPGADWAQYLIPFEASAGYAVNALQLGVQLAWKTQTVEVGGAACLNFKHTVSDGQLPLQLQNDQYPGSEPDAPWRAEAAASIDQLRKADLTVQVLDPGGNPLPNALVRVEMLQHEFKFGSAVISNRFGGGNAQDDLYEQKMLDLDGAGHGFNEVVFENDLKWPAWEQHWYSSWPEIAEAVQWLRDRDISVRGHNLVWPGWVYSPPDLEPNAGNPAYLRTRIRGHLDHLLSYPGVGAECADWDVLNEITQNNDYADALAGSPGFVTGRELYAQIFRQADSLAPNSVLYLNDYVAIERGDYDDGAMALWKTRLDELLAAGAPVEGIGFQGHFGAFPTGIPRVREILDDFWSAYGLEAKVTEFDIDKLVPPATQAAYTRDVLTAVYAHPSMKGFLMWGFWDGAHWQANAPLFYEDWSLKPSGEAFIDQVFHVWWTDETVPVSAGGTATVRGFRGKYRVEVVCGNTIQEQFVTLDGDKTLVFQLACTVKTRDEEPDWQLRLSPSPVSDRLRVSWAYPHASARIVVHDSAGRLVWEINATTPGQEVVLPVRSWAPGLYQLTLEIAGARCSRRFMVR